MADEPGKMTPEGKEIARTAKAEAMRLLADQPGVGGIGIGATPDRSAYAITIGVETPEIAATMPAEVLGVATLVHVEGPAVPFDEED